MYQFQTMRENGAAAQEEAEKERRRRRVRTRGNKKNVTLEGGIGTCNASDSIYGQAPEFSENGNGVLGAFPTYTTPPKASDITFNSVPQMKLSEGINGSAGIQEESLQISQSCPLPSSSVIQSRGFNAYLKEGKKCFDPHWPDQAVNDAIKKGSAFKATFRVNAHNLAEAYCTVDGISIDIMINGITAQNRAIEGDTVAITLDPVSCWNKMRGQNVNSNQTLETNPFTPENKTFIQNGSSSMIPLNPNINNGHTTKPLENPFETETTENGELTRALERINGVINSNPNKRPTGRVISIIKKSPRRNAVVGFFSTKPLLLQPSNNHYNNNNYGLMERKNSISLPALHLVPNDPRLPKMVINMKNLPESTKNRIRKSDPNLERELIAAKIDEWKEQNLFPKAQVLNILGKGGDIETQIASILFEHSIRITDFSPKSLSSLPNPKSWKVPESEIQSRRDLRKTLTFTIDPKTAVDLDDALSVELLPNKIFRIGVHIADVAHFVKPGTDLDAEAKLRATSVYIIQNKVSMLPKELSQGCVSLTPGFDRMAISVIWDVDFEGNILSRWIGKSVIFSSCQLSYDLVQEMINTGFNSSLKTVPKIYGEFKWEDVVNSVRIIYELSKRLKETRFKDGALRLDNLKLSFLFDEEGTPYDTYKDVERKEAYSLIEEFMLLANKSVAEVISSAYPDCALLRRHPEPNLRRLKEFEGFCAKHGFDLDASSSGKLHISLSKIRGKLQDDPLLFDILVYYACKPMLPASYFCTGDLFEKKDEWGHYALSSPFYTHFTSPIRRYADIIVHRTLYAVFYAEEKCGLMNKGVLGKCFTGIRFDEKVKESKEGKEALREGKERFRVLEREILGEVAEYCNERKLAAKHAEEAGQKLHLWALLKKKEFMVSEARVMSLGPKFMTVYVQKLAGERRIYYDEVEGLVADWLENTATLILDLRRKISFNKKGGNFFKHKPLEEFALIQNPADLTEEENENAEVAPAVFPMVLRNLYSVPVAIHAIGGDNGPIDVAVRLFTCSYLCEI